MILNKKLRGQAGSILIFSLLILLVLMTTSFALLALFVPKIRIASDPGNSTTAAYAADAAMEWCLYINRGGNTSVQMPTFSNTAVASVYHANETAITDCNTALSLDFRAVGTFHGVSRSFRICEFGAAGCP